MYSFDGSSRWQSRPDGVVFPVSTDQISRIMRLASENVIPVTVRGAGTCLSGGPIPIKGGIVLCTTRMNRIIEIDKGNFTVQVEAGVVLNDLNQTLAKARTFFSARSPELSGRHHRRLRFRKCGRPLCGEIRCFPALSSGYDRRASRRDHSGPGGQDHEERHRLRSSPALCGSEGTLAVVTRVTLRLLSLPESRQTVLATFRIHPEGRGGRVQDPCKRGGAGQNRTHRQLDPSPHRRADAPGAPPDGRGGPSV